jgi:spectinomycin phosphotransferase
VKERPDNIDQCELARVLQEQWGLASAQLQYAPVGFGDHHWELTDALGGHWFVTVADLSGGWRGTSPAAGYADLQASMETVIALGQAGLEFAVAPTPTAQGQALTPLGAEHAITVFPRMDGAFGDWGDEMPARDRLAVIDILAALHSATPVARRTARTRSPDLAGRPALQAALGELSQPWSGGPYSEPARQLLARHGRQLGRALARFDELVRETTRSGPAVLTHGEPHPGNIMRGAGKLSLIDWDTVGMALPERDLWMVAGAGTPEADRYAELTGRQVSSAALHMYRMRWSLDDITLCLGDFRGPHEKTEDTEVAWAAFTDVIEAIGELAR